MVLMLTVFMFGNLIPVQAAQEGNLVDKPLTNSTATSDLPQAEKYLSSLNLYLGSIDNIFGTETVSAVKQLQVQYGLVDDIP